MPPNKQPRRHVVRIVGDYDASPFERPVMESVLDLPTVEATDCVDNVVNENYCVESMTHLSNAEAANCVENSAVASSVIDCGMQSKVGMEDKATEICNFFSDIVHELKRKLKCVREKLRRREKKVFSMDDIISSLKEEGHLPEKLHNFLNHQKGTQVELVCNLVNNSLSSKGNRYTINVKMFAMTVYFYSPAAYAYLQKLMHLPHKSLISKWVAV
ncbi:uncharacterized protein LOC126411316 [Schistocerca serialis cubense]|uniref:uncharacterized protein LOC126411316 n=1 Tax=Schistocerca serialis cubense TaxID=2023355 RepID=UPI00214F58AF|nr:uncharacterized protein LOC126411316 [Schistocerca serialis cubense]